MVIRYNGIEINRKTRTVSHGDESYTFGAHIRSKSFEMFCHLVLGPGLSAEQLFWLAYGNDPDGGPLEGPHYFLILLNQLEKRFFDRLGIEWRAWRIAGVQFYCIVPRHQARDPKHRELYKNLRRRARAQEAQADV